MNVNDLFPSKYLKAHDLGGKAFTLTIRAATLEDVGHGLCECGCGQLTPVASRNNRSKGWVKGQPLRFVKGHKLSSKYESLEDAFWSNCTKSTKEECWLWQGNRLEAGYGRVRYLGATYGAHRLSYLIHHGDLADDLMVCHECDNPPCVNPHHLFIGDGVVNTADMVSKGRQALGERSAHAKLSEADVLEIRAARLAGASRKELAERFGVTPSLIGMIASRNLWKHVE